MATATAPNGFGRPAWDAIRNARQVHGWGLVPITVRVQGHSATFTRPLFVAPTQANGGYWKIERANVVTDTTIAGDGSNYWKLSLAVGGDLLGDEISNLGSTPANDIVAGTAYTLDINGPEDARPANVFLAAGDVLLLNAVKVSSGVDQSATDFFVQVLMRHTPPNR